MSKYAIYALGNALVDTEVETTETELENLGVEKGVMTLIDAPRMVELMSHFGHKVHNRACGGSAANSLIAAAVLGSACFYSCKVANDDTGHFYISDLLANGVDCNLNPDTLEAGNSGTCMVMVTKDAERTMNTFLGITGDLSEADINYTALKNSQFLYIEGYLMPSEAAFAACKQAIDFAKKNGVKTALTFSDPNMVTFCKTQLESIVDAGIDIVFCNEDEAMAYFEARKFDDALASLRKKVSAGAITRGAKGAVVWDETGVFVVDGVRGVKAIDSNGAGDCFAGTVLNQLAMGKTIEEAAALGVKTAALVVSQFGPRFTEGMLTAI